jgi:hypothetical protein
MSVSTLLLVTERYKNKIPQNETEYLHDNVSFSKFRCILVTNIILCIYIRERYTAGKYNSFKKNVSTTCVLT